MKYYAGIGSRKTPQDILDMMTKMAKYLSYHGYILRSGGAVGADKAFESGASSKKEIFYANDIKSDEHSQMALYLAKNIHPNWDACHPYAKRLHARNVFQILGRNLDSPVDFVLCWTEEAKKIGGTRTAIILAERNNIPIFNMGDKLWKAKFINWKIANPYLLPST